MSEDDKVISIGSRKPWLQEQAENRKAHRAELSKKRKAKNKAHADHRDGLLRMLDEARALVEQGRLEGMIIVGRDPKTKHFYTDLMLDETTVPRTDLYAFIGCVETLSSELKDAAMMAPSIQPDGSISDPYENLEAAVDELEGDYFE
jgi:hypothetical protein